MTATPPSGQPAAPGRLMAGEMAEQPAVLRRLLEVGAPAIRRTAEAVAAREPALRAAHRARHLRQRGAVREVPDRDHAREAVRADLDVHHHRLRRPADLTDVLVITVSQSGGSPDLVASTRAAREAGAITLAVTNNAGLAAGRGLRVPHRRAGRARRRRCPPPRRTRPNCWRCTCSSRACAAATAPAARRRCRTWPQQMLARGRRSRALAGRYRFAERMVITSRGYGYPTAKEAALKLMETSYIPALAYSGADLLHGPLAMVDNISPVIAIVTGGRGGEALQPVLDRLRGRGADLVVIGPRPQVGGGLGRLRAAHRRRAGGAAADPGDPAAAAARLRGHHGPRPGPRRAAGAGQGHRDPLTVHGSTPTAVERTGSVRPAAEGRGPVHRGPRDTDFGPPGAGRRNRPATALPHRSGPGAASGAEVSVVRARLGPAGPSTGVRWQAEGRERSVLRPSSVRRSRRACMAPPRRRDAGLAGVAPGCRAGPG